MFRAQLLCIVSGMALLAWPGGLLAQAPLQLGLTATATDGQRNAKFALPTPNFTLLPGESIHPTLKPEFRVEWNGVLKLARSGRYTLFADAKVFVDGKELQGQPTPLEAGERALRIEFTRKPAATARLQLQWESEHFAREPVPHTAFAYADSSVELFRTKRVERGRELVEELGCTVCHASTSGLVPVRSARTLNGGSFKQSVYPDNGWEHDLVGVRMEFPTLNRAMISDMLAAIIEANRGRGQPLTAETVHPTWEDERAGKAIFDSVGCAACHPWGRDLLGPISSTRAPRTLARYLLAPDSFGQDARMPRMNLSTNEARLLAEALMPGRGTMRILTMPLGDASRGRTLLDSTGCTSCHSTIELGANVKPKGPPLEQLRPGRGCLRSSTPRTTPFFNLGPPDQPEIRESLNAYLENQSVSAAPLQDFHRLVRKLNCNACHELYTPATFDFGEKPKPPSLTDAGNRLRASWLSQVLLEGKRVRPWMESRMPHYGEAARPLVKLFAQQAGAELGEGETAPAPTPAQAAEGLKLLGKGDGGLACINCHDFAGHRSAGDLRGPDMTEMHARIRTDWLLRWLREPSRLQPGTAMPAFFSELPTAEAHAKMAALVHALAAGKSLSLPEGLLAGPQDYRLVVRDEPVVFRTFIADSSTRSIAVGLPGGVNYVFDAEQCRVRYAWSGEFLDVAPVWTGRGGGPAKVLGKRFFTAPAGHPLRVGNPDAEPTLKFLGYRLVDKFPEFSFEVNGVPVRQRVKRATAEDSLEWEFALGETREPVWLLTPKGMITTYASGIGEAADARIKLKPGTRFFEVMVSQGRSSAN